MELNNKWRPWDNNHGISHRIFINEEETAIKDYIVANFLSQGLYLNDEDFIDIAYQAYLEKYTNEKMIKKDFLISRGFINDFEKRNRISSRKPHSKRRPTIFDEEKNEFIQKIQELLSTVDRSRVINFDETIGKVFLEEF